MKVQGEVEAISRDGKGILVKGNWYNPYNPDIIMGKDIRGKLVELDLKDDTNLWLSVTTLKDSVKTGDKLKLKIIMTSIEDPGIQEDEVNKFNAEHEVQFSHSAVTPTHLFEFIKYR